jgi:5-methylcytosine-specific restriction endonuclease McrA
MRLDEVDLLKFGHTIQMAGAVYMGEGRVIMALFPDEVGTTGGLPVEHLDMNLEDWTRFLQQTDLLETEILTKSSDGKLAKAIVRKSQRQISQGVSWTVYKRDGYRCRYCAADDVPLTVDHLVLWEEAGPSTVPNLVSACRRCNKARGNTQYTAWLEHPHYTRVSRNLDAATLQANQALVRTLDAIPRLTHQPTHR